MATLSHIKKSWLLIPLLLLLVSFGSSQAQTLKGKITDSRSGDPLTGASVTLQGGSRTYNTTAGLDGSYLFKNVQPGSYELKVQFVGYTMEWVKNLEISQGDHTRILSISLKANETLLAGVEVHAVRGKESDEFARKSEKLADNVVNIVSARAIEISPDITVGNVLQRVSGVSVIRSGSGDGQYAIIRGMDKRYNYTSVNGIILPSPDDKNRSVPMDMFPAEMIERLEVVKAITPAMEADAIGGATNLVMKNAPAKLTVNANFATGINEVFLNRPFSGFSRTGINFSSPSEIHGSGYVAQVSDFSVQHLNFHNVSLPLNAIGGLSIGNRILHKKLGYMLAGSYSRQYRGGNTTFYEPNGQPGVDPAPNTPVFLYLHDRQYSYLQSRLGLHAKLDYEIAPQHRINLYGLFLQLDENQHRSDVITGLGGTGEIDYKNRVIFQRKNLYNLTLSGTDKIINNLRADWALAYSVASSKTPDWTELVYFKDSAAATNLYASPLTHIWTHSKDQDQSGYLNFTYSATAHLELTAGGMLRTKDRSNFYNDYTLSTVIPGQSRQQYTDINQVVYSFRPASAAYADTTNPLNYTAHERVSAGYLQGKITLEKFQVLAGIRAEITHQDYFSQLSVSLPGKTGVIDYTDLLPNIHLKYLLTDRQNLRLSYFGGISRPNLFELVPAPVSGDFFTESGNYNLKHSSSDNLDFRYENFFSATDHLLAGVFYKHIVNPIEYAFVPQGGSNFIYEPTNPQASATNYGIELAFTKFIRKWGLSGNYSYTHSQVTTPKSVYGRYSYPNGQISPISFVNETRPLQGQADHIGNLSLLYKNPQTGFDAQLSFVYTGKRISVVSQFLGLDYWQRATSQLDFSAEKKLGGHWTVFVKATNLLNNHLYQDILKSNNLKGLPDQTNPGKILVQKDVFNRSFLAGVRLKFL